MQIRCERALLPDGIADDVTLEVGDDGRLVDVRRAGGAGLPLQRGLIVPGMPNLHSHAFQRAMAGSAEVQATAEGSFWGWRDVMYRFVEHLQPDDIEAIAALLYAEMLEAGYTAVAEFHYLHHDTDGSRYASAARLAEAVREAGCATAIRHLILPTLYQRGHFDDRPLSGAQQRFHHGTDEFLQLVETLRGSDDHRQRTGVALHSLRAVAPAALKAVVEAGGGDALPVHIHIAEQQREVDDCLAATGCRPVQWLLEHAAPDARWCLVHATHITAAERQQLAASGAVVGLCPTTEGNLGDGIFPLDAFRAEGGRFGIGSDSHVSVDPRDELRLAEYALRMQRQRRVLCTDASAPHLGASLWGAAVAGGARALGEATHGLTVGAVADFVRIDTDRVEFAGTTPAALLDAFIFAPRPGAVADVWVGGEHVVVAGRHRARAAIEAAYRSSLSRLRARGVA